VAFTASARSGAFIRNAARYEKVSTRKPPTSDPKMFVAAPAPAQVS
jgi:hypothetical protein